MSNPNAIWAKRLKEARLSVGLSQKQLGIQAGLDEFVASTRINRYELGVHKADYTIAQKLARVLQVPTSFFYEENDQIAEIAIIAYRLSSRQQKELVKELKTRFAK